MPREPQRATAELVHLLTTTRPDWREHEIRQVIASLTTTGWSWARILASLPRTAAETDSRPWDVPGARRPNRVVGTPPTEEWRSVRAAMTGAG
ncbi:hypothetical protein [Microtetraspora malaysiensis]|uniref:Transposase n=1 Tax=Microtetraspora malaysiensis TaxID=161358 RepID=A0ABW6T5D6_9ACTN